MNCTRNGIAIAAACLLGVSALSAQVQKPAPAAKSSAWVQGKTADGQPDMQGTWTNATNVPFQRPKELGAKEFFTPQEQADFQAKANGYAGDRANLPDAHYDLSQFGLGNAYGKVSANNRTSLIVGPEGKVPPTLPAAQKRAADKAAANRGHQFDGPENRGLAERCILWGNEGPPMMPVGYNSDLQIVQGPGYVAILQEMIHDVRIIPTDNSPHLPSNIRQWFGDSRGHWEGDTLVVDTTNFTDKTAFRGSGENLHVVEKFTRTDADTVLYEFTVSDPSTWEKSWSAQVPMTKINSPIYEYACQEGNISVGNALRGDRAEEIDLLAEVRVRDLLPVDLEAFIQPHEVRTSEAADAIALPLQPASIDGHRSSGRRLG